LRINKGLLSMPKDQADIAKGTVWIPDSKKKNGVAEIPLTPIAVHAFRNPRSRWSSALRPLQPTDPH
jgi:hypothetical protein